jgi:DNA polymerase-3 subunit delta'
MLFSELVGQQDDNLPKNQEGIKEYFNKSIKDKNISHGYIFEGAKGIGKLNMAIFFAKSLLCKDYKDEPCNVCSSCIKVKSMNHPDLHIISSEEKSIKREDIDDLILSIYHKPYESDRKIYIINKSEDMTMQAANTFLKTLEEPAGNTTIMLLTHNCNLLLSTIVSRCQLIKFEKNSNEQIIDYIKKEFDLDFNTARLIAYYSQGVLYNAEKIATNQNDILKRREEIIKIFDRILIHDKNAIFEYETYFEDNKDKIDEITEILMIWLRDISYKKHDIDDLIINTDFVDLLEKHTKTLDRQKIDELINYLQNVKYDIKSNVNYKLIIDNMLMLISK